MGDDNSRTLDQLIALRLQNLCSFVCAKMASPTPPENNIPITVFTGFLGAGKTSIILSLLPQLPKDYKVVLLKNEFGDLEGADLLVSCLQLTLLKPDDLGSRQPTCETVEPGGRQRDLEWLHVIP